MLLPNEACSPDELSAEDVDRPEQTSEPSGGGLPDGSVARRVRGSRPWTVWRPALSRTLPFTLVLYSLASPMQESYQRRRLTIRCAATSTSGRLEERGRGAAIDGPNYPSMTTIRLPREQDASGRLRELYN